MIYELWLDDNTYSFFPADNADARAALEPNAKLIWTVEAETWDEASARQHAYLGWEPYRPLDDN